MNVWKDFDGLSGALKDPRQIARINSFLIHSVLVLGSLFASYVILSRMGTQLFMMAIIGVFFGTIYTVISFGNLFIPFIIWIMSIFGFRFLWSIQAPGLPDLYLDRMTMVWLAVVFFVKFFAEKRRLRGPFLLDFLMLVNAAYILIGIYVQDMVMFHDWTMSYLVPYAAYFFAKNLVITNREIRMMLWALLALFTYYSIISVAEKFGIAFLIWPKYIIAGGEFWGRSNGPFGHAPLFGTVIGMMMPISLYFIATVENRFLKIVLTLGLMAGFAGLFFTYTRGSWLAGIAAILTTAVLNRRSYLKIVLPVFVVAPFVAIMFLGFGEDKMLKSRVENEDTLGSRFGTWVTAGKVWRANPLFGVGFNKYRYVLDDYVEPLDLPIIGVVNVSQFRNNPPHDIYISFLAETGLVGVGLQMAIYLVMLRVFLAKYAWRKRGDYFAVYILPVFGGIFVGYLVGGLAIDYKFFSVVQTMFYSCAGIMYGYRSEDSLAAEAAPQGIRGHGTRSAQPTVSLRQPTSQVD